MIFFFTGTELVTQIVPISSAIKKIPGRRDSALYELVFLAIGIPALGYQSFYVSEKSQESGIQSDEPISSQHSWSIGGDVSKKTI